MREDESPLQHLRRKAPEEREQVLRDFLGRFKFSGDMASSPVGPFSGGEKARLALALLAWDKPNLLVLDEPTNHLDMETREALTMALSSFEGSVLIVSHDRHLLSATTERLMLVHNGEVSEFDGDLDDYATLVLENRKATLSASKAKNDTVTPNTNKKEARQQAAQERQRIAQLKKPLQKQLSAIEKKLDPLNKELKELDEKLADSAFYEGNPDDVAQTLKRRGEVAQAVEELEMQWLEVSEAIEAIV